MFLLDYILLRGILSNPRWWFSWHPTYLYEWVDSVQNWLSYCLWVAWGLAWSYLIYLLL